MYNGTCHAHDANECNWSIIHVTDVFLPDIRMEDVEVGIDVPI